MGCCSSKAQLKLISDPSTGATATHRATDPVRQPTNSEKRSRAAEAAEARKTDWRQGGASDPDKARSLQQRREKEELLGQIHTRYAALGKDPPIGLPSCDVPQLRRHLETLRK
ncbi:hypothetical protein PybrP1_009331 [[Pythium] brassicae (nom. inval.)]|nr:hypothetical protein PybrP1_009331 [[Pythium] brassicae (nom. inval.)]